MRADREGNLARLAARQVGLVTRRQLRALGIGRTALERRLESGAWRSLPRGVVCVASGDLSRDQRELAGQFAAGEGAVLSHHSAGARLGLDVPKTPVVHVLVPWARKRVGLDGVKLWRTRDLQPDDVTERGPFRLTRLGRTVLDLAAVLDDAWLAVAVDSALRRSAANRKWMELALEQHGSGRPGVQRLRRILDARAREDSTPDSALESLAMELGLAAGRKPHLHFRVCTPRFFVAEVDLAWPEARLAVELDSWSWHSSRVAFERDRARDRALHSLGWVVLRFTWRQVELDRQAFINELARHYQRGLGLERGGALAAP